MMEKYQRRRSSIGERIRQGVTKFQPVPDFNQSGATRLAVISENDPGQQLRIDPFPFTSGRPGLYPSGV